jgi:hypothetical protein
VPPNARAAAAARGHRFAAYPRCSADVADDRIAGMNTLEFVFAVVDAPPDNEYEPSPVNLVRVYGTAFAIGGGAFLTASHVATEALRRPNPRLAYGVGNILGGAPVVAHELCPALDLAVLRAHVPNAKAAPWRTADVALTADVYASGFPYALDETGDYFSVRAFKGYVVARVPFTRLPGAPLCYELSFQAPRGLSGAPLWTFGPSAGVQGIVIGNRATEMTVFSSRERVNDGSELTVERFEALQLGIALHAEGLLAYRSTLLGCTLADHLQAHGLL